jgi:hypothetical protein
MEFIDLAEPTAQTSIIFELLYRRSATPKSQRPDGFFPFRTSYLRWKGIAPSTIYRELRRLERLKLIEIKPHQPGHPTMVRIPERFFGARKQRAEL